jgi:hypothetical protein
MAVWGGKTIMHQLGMLVLIVLLVVCIVMIVYLRVRRHRSAKVARLVDYRKSPQRCSQCKRRADKVVFYADPGGKVVGLCSKCRRKAEQNGYLPI